MSRFLDAALRRIRLLTALALMAGLWLIVRSDLSWRASVIAAAALVVGALLAAGIRLIVARRSRTRRRT